MVNDRKMYRGGINVQQPDMLSGGAQPMVWACWGGTIACKCPHTCWFTRRERRTQMHVHVGGARATQLTTPFQPCARRCHVEHFNATCSRMLPRTRRYRASNDIQCTRAWLAMCKTHARACRASGAGQRGAAARVKRGALRARPPRGAASLRPRCRAVNTRGARVWRGAADGGGRLGSAGVHVGSTSRFVGATRGRGYIV